MAMHMLRHLLAGMLSIILPVMATSVHAAAVNGAAADTALSKVLFMATVKKGPAMRPVKWSLYRVENGKSIFVDSFKRHSASLELEPGVYRADAALDGVSRSRTFDIRTVSNSNVIIAMD